MPSTHIYPLQPVQGIHITHQKLFICFFIFFSTQNESPNNAANVLKLNIYISINYLWHTLWHLAGPGAERGSSGRVREESPLETAATVRFLLSSFRHGCNYLSCQEESRCHLSWPRIFLAQLEIKLTATATSGREREMCGEMWSCGAPKDTSQTAQARHFGMISVLAEVKDR